MVYSRDICEAPVKIHKMFCMIKDCGLRIDTTGCIVISAAPLNRL